MLNKINLSESYFARFPVRQPREPRTRFIRYYQDLYAVYGEQLSQQTFLAGSQYSFTELGDGVFAKIPKNTLSQIDLFVVVAWSHEFDPDYASAGTYFFDRHELAGKIIDVSDHGSLGFFTALNITKKYLQASQYNNVMILVMEQTTTPGGEVRPTMPLHDVAFGLLVSKKSFLKNNYEIILSEVKQKEKIKSVDKLVFETCNIYSIPQSKFKLIFKNNSVFHYQYENSHLCLENVVTNIIPNYPGVFPLLACLHDLQDCDDVADLILMLDEDAETADIGYVLLRRYK